MLEVSSFPFLPHHEGVECEVPHKAWAVAVALGVLAASGATIAAATPSPKPAPKHTSEEDQLQKLYKGAVAEGGRLVVYMRR